MSQTLEDLQTEWDAIKDQINAVKAEYNRLRSKRSNFHVTVFLSSDASPESLVTLEQQTQDEAQRWSLNLQQLDQEIQSTRIKLRQVRAKLAVKQAQIYRFQAQKNWIELKKNCDRINQLANSLEEEIFLLCKNAENFQPTSEDWLPKYPQLLELETINIPCVKIEDKQFKLTSKPINFNFE
ncbi:conserved hypothetical protein [Planktothrix sp. PCC 11201]|uniref:hypothetical protein n=1 Tax=Planktothrix sp. PCC 11201 TaxID=1729650 RepID=UPI000915B664|nr:hypothetical protein [Planktothrix sp. PCC 11201]SKB11298.1 conserved hypothetical protein [Planktothrix sp. PCC 11201]